MPTKVILVGHCGVDAPRLEKAVWQSLGKVDVIPVNSEGMLEEVLDDGADLLLFNRELPYGFEESEGLDLMEHVRRRHPELKVMLVSDSADAQDEAEEMGALPGFGKSQLGSDAVSRCLRRAMAFVRQTSSSGDGERAFLQ
jgi:hypothetical protein